MNCIHSRAKYIFHFYISHIFLHSFFFFIFRNNISSLKPIFKPLAYIRIHEFRPSHQDIERDTRFSFDVTQISLRRARLSEVMYMRRCYEWKWGRKGPGAIRRLTRSKTSYCVRLSLVVVIGELNNQIPERQLYLNVASFKSIQYGKHYPLI